VIRVRPLPSILPLSEEKGMAHLVVMVCLLATPTKCQEFTVPDFSTDDVVSCIRQGGDKSDEWQRANNKYFVIGWRCIQGDAKPKS
jgi:hypothetical protein